MTISLKHSFTSPKADGTDSTLVQPSNWNQEHALSLAAGKVLGRATGSAGAAQELPLVFDATLQSMIPPSGTTAERPATPAAGMMRYNSTTLKLEIYTNGAWTPVGGSAAVSATAPTSPQPGDLWYDSAVGVLKVYNGTSWVVNQVNQSVDVFSGTGSATVFTLSQSTGSRNNTEVYISGVYQQKSTYTVAGTALTFGAAPPAGTGNIEVMVTAPVSTGVPNDGSVGTAKLQDGSITGAKLSPDAVHGQTAKTTLVDADEDILWDSVSSLLRRMTWANRKLALAKVFSPLPGYLFGLTLSNNVADAANDIDIAAGSAADSTGVATLRLASGITKRLDANWTVGTGSGGLDTGTAADGTYHLFLIMRSDTGVVDVLFSLSATAPTMPANYDFKRRIGSIVRVSSAIVAFYQFGDEFYLKNRSTEFNGDTGTTAAVTLALRVPTGLVLQARILAGLRRTNGSGLIYMAVSPLTENDNAPSSSFYTLAALVESDRGNASTEMQIMTNTLGQIRFRTTAAANTPVDIWTIGWRDTRDRI